MRVKKSGLIYGGSIVERKRLASYARIPLLQIVLVEGDLETKNENGFPVYNSKAEEINKSFLFTISVTDVV